ncbi:MAG: molybdenum cofactor guanylyltransferase [Caulobacteraceae bacterium]|nr:MAG: molybdenum cofactor guanylyltransferase [Caulobacteraceae bacterium]
MSGALDIVGLVLAGGRSSRFGSEKAVAAYRGRLLLDWSLEPLAGCRLRAVNAAFGSGAASRAEVLGLTVLPDAPGDPDGPLAGVRAGLAWAVQAGAAWLATTPCDTPDLPGDLVARLAEASGGTAGAYAVSPEGREPLCALWSADLLEPLSAVLARGHPPVRGLQDSLGLRPAAFPDARLFRNLNQAP